MIDNRPPKTGLSSKRIAAICIGLFILAFGVRFVTWQNNKVEMSGVQYVLTELYKREARVLLSGDIRAFLAGPNPPSDASVLLHPPGYPLVMTAVYGIFGENDAFLMVQILLNSLASVLVFFIALSLFDIRTAVIAGALTAFAPQFAYHSAVMLPDELSAMPILLGVYFYVRGIESKRLPMAILCGVSIGLSCWLRSNALLLPLFFALFSVVILSRQTRVKFALALIAGFIITISPITMRNYLVFKSFIPLSVGMGTTFVEGLGDYDQSGRFGMPNTDESVMAMDARLADRPDYIGSLYNPDGIKRERERVRVGLEAVKADPAWFMQSVLHRGSSTLRLERVPAIAPERDEKATTPLGFYYLNVPLKLFQRLFITAVFLPLFVLGMILLALERQGRIKLMALAVVPVYYFCIQSLIHTEYRYVLATTHIIMIFSAVSLSFLIAKLAGLRRPGSNVQGVAGSQ